MNPDDPLKKRIKDIRRDLNECARNLFMRPCSPYGYLQSDDHRIRELCKDASALIKELSK